MGLGMQKRKGEMSLSIQEGIMCFRFTYFLPLSIGLGSWREQPSIGHSWPPSIGLGSWREQPSIGLSWPLSIVLGSSMRILRLDSFLPSSFGL